MWRWHLINFFSLCPRHVILTHCVLFTDSLKMKKLILMFGTEGFHFKGATVASTLAGSVSMSSNPPAYWSTRKPSKFLSDRLHLQSHTGGYLKTVMFHSTSHSSWKTPSWSLTTENRPYTNSQYVASSLLPLYLVGCQSRYKVLLM